MPAHKGQKKVGGRKKGTPNKFTADIKGALYETFDRGGGVGWMTTWAKKNPTEFFKLLVKTMPTELKGSLSLAGRLVIEEVIVSADHAQNIPPAPRANGVPAK
jgi:hypothetical protein